MSSSERLPFKVADLSLAELGRKEIRLAEHEMPGLMALRRRHGGRQPLATSKIPLFIRYPCRVVDNIYIYRWDIHV